MHPLTLSYGVRTVTAWIELRRLLEGGSDVAKIEKIIVMSSRWYTSATVGHDQHLAVLTIDSNCASRSACQAAKRYSVSPGGHCITSSKRTHSGWPPDAPQVAYSSPGTCCR
jgi:hypothetical protein